MERKEIYGKKRKKKWKRKEREMGKKERRGGKGRKERWRRKEEWMSRNLVVEAFRVRWGKSRGRAGLSSCEPC